MEVWKSVGKIYDMVILGSGPAGLSAAIYAQRACLDTLVIEKEFTSGGQMASTYEVDNYPGLPGMGGFDMGMKFREHAEKLGASFVNAEVVSLQMEGEIKVVSTMDACYKARTVVIATGARHRLLQVPGEEELTGMGVSYCATCDGAFFRDKTVAVVGGGDVAIEDAVFLARSCKKVYLIHRRDQLRGARSLQEKLFSLPNVEIVWNTVVTRIEGEDQVEAVKLHNNIEGTDSTRNLDGVFIAVGITPNSSIFKEMLSRDELGYIKADEECRTNVEGIYAAGDVRTKSLRQIVTAVADGANAVYAASEYLMRY